MSIISFHNVSYVLPDGNPLLETLDLTFGRERVAVVGPNGIGKTTLLKLACGELQPSAGSVERQGMVRVFRQILQTDATDTVADAFGIGGKITRLMQASKGKAHAEEVSQVDWTLEARLGASLRSVGLENVATDRPLSTLSGGQHARVALAALVFDEPDMILLDEPTNNLDRQGKRQIYDVLANWRGGAIVVSHDRALLRCVDRIVELSSLGVRVYGGNWDSYSARKEKEQETAERQLASAEHRLKLVRRKVEIARERKAKRDAMGRRERPKSSQTKMVLDARKQRAENTAGNESRLATRRLDQAAQGLEKSQAAVERVKKPCVRLSSVCLPAGRTALVFDRVTGGYDVRHPVVRNLSFSITGPERIAIAGPNGSGKTTALKLALGKIDPFSGEIHRPVPAAMLEQQLSMLNCQASVLDNFRRFNPADNDNACHAALARFLFRADTAFRRLDSLSGGETLRAGLACVLGGSEPPQLLMLDEPTNHLDLVSIASLESGLNGYDGALLVISHDDDFLEAIGIERVITLEAGRTN